MLSLEPPTSSNVWHLIEMYLINKPDLPLVMYRTTSIMMPTLLNINAVNCRQWSFARSVNGGFGKLCRLRSDLNDFCRSIVIFFYNFFFSSSSALLSTWQRRQTDYYSLQYFCEIFLLFLAFLFRSHKKKHAPLFADWIFFFSFEKEYWEIISIGQ